MIPINRAVLRIQAIIRTRRLIRRCGISRKAGIEVKGRLQAADGAGKTGVWIQAVQRHAASPAGIKRLRKEDAVAGSDDSLGIKAVGDANTWRKTFVPNFFWISLIGTGELKPAGAISCSRIGTEIKKCQVVAGFLRWREAIPAETIIEAQLLVDLPCVSN